MFISAASNLTSQFTGKERDAETGLDYFGARYFSGAQGRFITPDWSADPQPVPYANFEYPQTLNLYSYAGNNPLSRTDPDGHFWQELKNKLKWGVWTKDAGVEAALQERADEARQEIAGLKNLTINGESPADAVKGLSNKQTISLQRSIVGSLAQEVLGQPKTMIALALVTEGAGGLEAATTAAVAAGRASSWIVKTGKSALAADITTNITAQEFGVNLEASGYVKSLAKDGVTKLYSKGNEVYSVYPKSSSTGGPTANLNVGGKIITKIRLQ
jgi:RHS repeat-associated protein